MREILSGQGWTVCRRMRKRFRNNHDRRIRLFLLILLLSQTPRLAAQPYRTHSMVLADCMEKVAQEAIQVLGMEEGTAVRIEEWHGALPLNRFLANRFFQTLMEAGVSVRGMNAQDSLDLSLGMMITHLYVFYDRIVRRWPWSKALVERCAGLAVSLRITDMYRDTVIFSEEIKADTVDFIPAALLDEIEEADHLMEKPDPPPMRGLYAWIEPVGVALILAVVASLFYSIRSG